MLHRSSKKNSEPDSHGYFSKSSIYHESDASKRYPFVIKFHEECGYRCHNNLKDQLDSNFQYSAIAPKFVMVMTSNQRMVSIKKVMGENISEYGLLLPEVKIDDVVFSRNHKEWNCKISNVSDLPNFNHNFERNIVHKKKQRVQQSIDSSAFRHLNLAVVIMALDTNEMADFIAAVNAMLLGVSNLESTQNRRSRSIHGNPLFKYDISEFGAGDPRTLKITVSDCRFAIDVLIITMCK